jgi:hypothetical protein
MKTKMVSHTFDTIPELTEADMAHLKKLAALPDSEIDTTDSPEMTDEQWKIAIRRRRYPAKDSVPAGPELNGSANKQSAGSPK